MRGESLRSYSPSRPMMHGKPPMRSPTSASSSAVARAPNILRVHLLAGNPRTRRDRSARAGRSSDRLYRCGARLPDARVEMKPGATVRRVRPQAVGKRGENQLRRPMLYAVDDRQPRIIGLKRSMAHPRATNFALAPCRTSNRCPFVVTTHTDEIVPMPTQVHMPFSCHGLHYCAGRRTPPGPIRPG
jgi:hypothetical protein